jgi:hypothetical protein
MAAEIWRLKETGTVSATGRRSLCRRKGFQTHVSKMFENAKVDAGIYMKHNCGLHSQEAFISQSSTALLGLDFLILRFS